MYQIVESAKDFEQASADLQAAVSKHGFGVLHVHDLAKTLQSKGVAFAEQCQIFEVCNPKIAAQVLAVDMRLNMALPCRLSVYTEAGKTYISMIKPAAMLASLSPDPALVDIARSVEQTLSVIIEAAK
jgi:uncharacterized protein (DUF302 family)